jgi:hypothetical protein
VLSNTLPNVAIGCVFDNVADIVQCAACPVAAVCAKRVSNGRVAVSIKAKRFVGTQAGAWKRHVDCGWISLWRAQCTLQTLGILLREDCLLIHFIVDRVGKEVATSHKVCRALNGAIANNGDLRCTSWRCHQGDRASAV